MKKSLAIILLATVTMGFASFTSAATPEETASYKVAKESADAKYKLAHENCKSLTGNPKDVCIEEAKAARTRTKADAEAHYKNTSSARAAARKNNASAEYEVAKAKCGSKNGNEKDVCIKEAKAAKVSANADTAVDKKVVAARVQAHDEKREANYKVEIEKCDALAGVAKNGCVTSAKAQFGK